MKLYFQTAFTGLISLLFFFTGIISRPTAFFSLTLAVFFAWYAFEIHIHSPNKEQEKQKSDKKKYLKAAPAVILALLIFIYGLVVTHSDYGNTLALFYFAFWVGMVIKISNKFTTKKPIKKSKEDLIREKADDIFYKVREKSLHKPLITVLKGGSGLGLEAGGAYYIACTKDEFLITQALGEHEANLPMASFIAAEVSGPGTQITNAGMVGGGFGVQGAVTGIVIASLINSATTRKSTNTFLRIVTTTGEAIFHFNDIEPDELRLVLSPLFVSIEKNRLGHTPVQSLTSELEKLNQLKIQGVITESEFETAKAKILGSSQ